MTSMRNYVPFTHSLAFLFSVMFLTVSPSLLHAEDLELLRSDLVLEDLSFGPTQAQMFDWVGVGHRGETFSISDDGTVLALSSAEERLDRSELNVGAVHVFALSDQWRPLGNVIRGTQPYHALGTNVSLNESGTLIAIGARRGMGSSRDRLVPQAGAQLLKLEGNEWIQIGDDIARVRFQTGDPDELFLCQTVDPSSFAEISRSGTLLVVAEADAGIGGGPAVVLGPLKTKTES
mgnify:FL=1